MRPKSKRSLLLLPAKAAMQVEMARQDQRYNPP
jgi:hypothetical protein